MPACVWRRRSRYTIRGHIRERVWRWSQHVSFQGPKSRGGSLARKLKIFQTSLGFYELTIAAPFMKAALEAWGADSNLSIRAWQRKATKSAAILSKFGVIHRRPIGSDGLFRETAEPPTNLADDGNHRLKKARTRPKKLPPGTNDKADRNELARKLARITRTSAIKNFLAAFSHMRPG